MSRIVQTLAVLMIIVLGAAAGAVGQNLQGSRNDGRNHWLVGEVKLGYYRGVGLHASLTALNFAQNFPFSVRIGLGYTRVSAGDGWAARRVFINNNTNGTARSNARVWDARLDVLCPLKLLNLKRTTFFAGLRHSDFDAYFEYIGGAETFDVKTSQWGLGSGIETAFALSPLLDMVFTLGADYYFRSTLSGHDTYYRPNGDDTHPIGDYTYKAADEAINQPDVMTRLMVGLSYHF